MSKTALITGGTRGIGLGIARALYAEGFNLILCGRRHIDELGNLLSSFGSAQSVEYVQADIGDKEDRRRLLEVVQDRHQHLSVLVNNAGMAPRQRNHVLEASEESFEEVLRVNLQGPYFLTQACAQWMINQPTPGIRNTIININSVSSVVASVSRGEYCVSKAGLSMTTKLWAVSLAPHNIDVFEIRPGLIETDMTAGVKSKYDTLIEGDFLLEKRWGTPEDIGKATAMLTRGDLPYATGQVLTMDGGWTLERL